MTETIAFIGGGNMAASLIGGLLAAGQAPEQLRCAVRSADSAARLRQRFGIAAGTDRIAAIEAAETVVLAVKPQQLREAVAGLQPMPGATIVSVAAGVRIATLRRWFAGAAGDIVRSMPNTPALIRQGATGLYAEPAAAPASRARAETLMRAVGSVCWVDSEAALDALTALSGSGPAYFFLFVEALREAGGALGLPAPLAARLALETFTGAAALAAARDEDVAELRRQVTSKGGTTEAAVDVLETGGLRSLLHDALTAAARRAGERALAADAES